MRGSIVATSICQPDATLLDGVPKLRRRSELLLQQRNGAASQLEPEVL
jgi:hypothetical protein